MTLVAPDISEVTLLKLIVNKQSNGNLLLKLFDNDITPGESTPAPGAGPGPVETTGAGYSAITLTGSSWTVATSLGVTTAQYAAQVFTFSGDVDIYGYFITTSGGDLLWLERFSGAPYSLPVSGGTITITPKITLS
jgi:hypothetical protein